ncbi:MAG: hypothetical protein GF416_08495 [Candidatus Altiarchaeales archaeon]|nr:hypothetical protein [Candidatus Altiarchaeales archaeon]MBD3417154.1 hypothetical protein [Candidatus Altiarchaeales archaeon]
MYSTEYQRIYNGLKSPQDIKRLAKEEGLDEELLLVILTQKTVRSTKRDYYAIKKKAPSLLGEWMHGKSFLQIAHENSFPPVLTASLMLQHTGVTKKQFKNYLRDPDRINDERLKKDLKEAIEEELIYSPEGTRIQFERGKDVERIVKKWLDQRRVKYITEQEAKKGNYTKTPDFNLESPFKMQGKWLNWVECKASFGDESEYKRDYGKQLSHYVKLFGKGMVVYWYGYIEDMPNHLRDDDIVIGDRRLFE